MCIGKPEDFLNLCNEMVRTEILVDYIQVDGAEGGTIGAPWELINSVGMPFWDGVHFVHSALSQKGLRNEITVLGSGKILTGFDIFKAIALGADGCCIARGMLLALGCVQAGKCKEGKCPAGIASPNGYRSKAIVIKQKARGVANYHNEKLQAFDMLLGVAGLGCADQITPDHIYKRLSDGSIKNYNQILSTTGIIQV